MESQCAFYTVWPYSHTHDGQDHYWCKLTTSCCDKERVDIEVQVHAKRAVGYDPDSSIGCDSWINAETDAAASTRGSFLLAGLFFLWIVVGGSR